MKRSLQAIAAAGFLALSACRSVTPPGAFFDTSPPGAEVLIDGRRSGFVTPCRIALLRDRRYRVSFVLEGYQPRVFELVPHGRAHTVTWDDGAMSPEGIGGVFALETKDIFLPHEVDNAHAPNRIFVRLIPSEATE